MADPRVLDWTIVLAIAVCFLLIPALIIWRPPGFSFRFSFLILPLIPAVGLAMLGVWFALRRRG